MVATSSVDRAREHFKVGSHVVGTEDGTLLFDVAWAAVLSVAAVSSGESRHCTELIVVHQALSGTGFSCPDKVLA